MRHHHACSQEPHWFLSSTTPFQLTTVQHKRHELLRRFAGGLWLDHRSSKDFWAVKMLRTFWAHSVGARQSSYSQLPAVELSLKGCWPVLTLPNSGLPLCSRLFLLVVGLVSSFSALCAAPASEPLSFDLLLCSWPLHLIWLDLWLHPLLTFSKDWLPGCTVPLIWLSGHK